jgi:hypothetical protein
VGQGLIPSIGIAQKGEHPLKGLFDPAAVVHVPPKAQPDTRRPHRGAEPHEIVVENEAQQSAKRDGVRFVDRLEDDLAESLGALCRQQQVPEELPSFRAICDEQGPCDVPTHGTDFMGPIGRSNEDVEHLVTLGTAIFDGPSQ